MLALKKYSILNYAIALFFLSTPIESIAIAGGFSIAKTAALVVYAAWILSKLPFKRTHMLKSFLVLSAYAILGLLWSIDRGNSFLQIATFLIPSVIVTYAMTGSLRKMEDIKLYCLFYVIGCTISVASALMIRDTVVATADYVGSERLSAFGQDKNTFAFLLCMGCSVVFDWFRKARKLWLKVVSGGLLLSFSLVIFSSGSRTGVIMLAVIALVYMLSPGERKNKILISIVVVLAIPFVIAYVPETIWDRFQQTEEYVESGDFNERGVIWASGIKAFFMENFLMGVGYSNFSTMLLKHFGWQMASHNTYLSYLVDFGFLGCGIFIYILWNIFKTCWQICRKLKDRYYWAYVLPFFIVMLTLETEYKRWIFMIAILIEAFYTFINQDRKIENENTPSNTDVRDRWRRAFCKRTFH